MGALIAGIALIVVAAAVLVAALVSSGDDANNNFGTNPVGSPTTPCSQIVHAVIRIKQLDPNGWMCAPRCSRRSATRAGKA